MEPARQCVSQTRLTTPVFSNSFKMRLFDIRHPSRDAPETEMGLTNTTDRSLLQLDSTFASSGEFVGGFAGFSAPKD